MDQRVYQVCLTYLQRWPVRLMAVGYLVACVIGAQFAWSTYNKITTVSPTMPRPGQMANVTPLGPLEQMSREASSMYWTVHPLVPLQATISQPFLKLRSLEFAGTLKSGEELKVLRSMPNLEAFAYNGDLPAEGLEYIGELSHLRYLRLLKTEEHQGLQYLRTLTKLDTLDVGSVYDYDRLFEEIRKLPNLRTLIVPGPFGAAFHPADWQKLTSLPQLRRIYFRLDVHQHSSTPRSDIQLVQQVLPRVAVRPSAVSERRTNACWYIFLASDLIWGIIFLQLLAQFSHPASRLTPNYGEIHLRVAGTIIALTTLVHTLIMWSGGCSLVAGLAASLFTPGLFWWWIMCGRWSSNSQQQAASLNPLFSFAVCFQMFPITLLCSKFFLSDADWFLLGHYPFAAWTVIILSLVSHYLAFQGVPRWHSIYAECGTGLPPLGVSSKAWTAWAKDLAAAQGGTRLSLFKRSSIARLDALLALPVSRVISQLSIANSFSGWQLSCRLLGLVIGFLGVYFLLNQFGWVTFSPYGPPPLVVMLLVSTWLDSLTLILVLVWRGRRPMLGYELLRPISRARFVRQLFAAIGRDLIPVLVLHPIVIALFVWTFGTPELPHLFVPIAISYCVFRGICIYTAIIYLLTIHREWVVWMLLWVIWVVIFATGLMTALGSMGAANWLSLGVIALYAAASVLVLLRLRQLHRTWQQMELP